MGGWIDQLGTYGEAAPSDRWCRTLRGDQWGDRAGSRPGRSMHCDPRTYDRCGRRPYAKARPWTCVETGNRMTQESRPGRGGNLFVARAAGRRRVAEALFIFNLTTRGERGRQSSGGELGEGEGWPGGVVGGRSGRRRGHRRPGWRWRRRIFRVWGCRGLGELRDHRT